VTVTADSTVYVKPNQPAVFGTLPAGSTVQILAHTTDGWDGFDPGVAQAGNTGLDRLRWIGGERPGNGYINISAGCNSMPTITYP
jgi:hypothetical protein